MKYVVRASGQVHTLKFITEVMLVINFIHSQRKENVCFNEVNVSAIAQHVPVIRRPQEVGSMRTGSLFAAEPTQP